jgi:choline kinase
LGKPLLHWQVEALRAAGVGPIAVVRGYLGYLVDGPGITVFENARWAETSMVASLARAQVWLEAEPCIVSYADIVFHPDSLRALMGREGDIAITYDRHWLSLWRDRFADPLSDAETLRLAPGGFLGGIGGRPASLAEVQGQYMGLLKFTPVGWGQARALLGKLDPATRDALDMTGLLKRLLEAAIPVTAVPVDGRWCEVDSERDLLLYEARLRNGNGWSHDWRW